jgi:N-acetylglucosaminyl-diphospho-decaprenol L-rhamnosyltransferase
MKMVALTPQTPVAAVVVNWNTKQLLHDGIINLHESMGLGGQTTHELVIVDNGSADGSLDGIAASWPQVNVIANTTNVGFCIASNQGIRATIAPYVLLINTDARIDKACLSTMCTYLDEHPEAGVIAPRLVYGDGRFQRWTAGKPLSLGSAANYFFGLDRLTRFTPRSRFFEGMYCAVDTAHVRKVGWVSSAVMLVRRTALDTVGLLDENIFLYMDDVDLCHRMRRGGYDVVYAGNITATHFMGSSSARTETSKASPAAIRSLLSWYRRTHGPIHAVAFRIIVAAGFALRSAGYALSAVRTPRSPKRRAAWQRSSAHLKNLSIATKGTR